MKFGVHLPIYEAGRPAPLTYLSTYVAEAGRLGYEALAFNDNFVANIDAVVAVSSVLSQSGRMQIVGSVMLPIHRGLIPSAKTIAALDRLAEGRVVAGVGTGSQQREYEISGIPWEERWQRFEEMVPALRSLLAEGAAPFSGRFYSTEGVVLTPRPIQPAIPLWIGSWGSDAGLRRVARLADGWLASHMHATPDSFAAAREKLAGFLTAQGKDPATFPNALSTLRLFVSEDPARLAEVRQAAEERARTQHPVRLPPIIGTPEEVAAEVSAFAAAGVQAAYVSPFEDPLEQVTVFMERVVPLVQH